jgi:hypothetical protein
LSDEVTDDSQVCDGGRFEALIQVKGRAFSQLPLPSSTLWRRLSGP